MADLASKIGHCSVCHYDFTTPFHEGCGGTPTPCRTTCSTHEGTIAYLRAQLEKQRRLMGSVLEQSRAQITTLTAQRDRLREALKKIVENRGFECEHGFSFNECQAPDCPQAIAHAALDENG